MKGVELNAFKLDDFGIPYGYRRARIHSARPVDAPLGLTLTDAALLVFCARSPLLVADPSRLDAASTKAFLAATARGFELCASEPDTAAALFFDLASKENPDLPTPLDAEMCARSARYLAAEKCLLNEEGVWGRMTVSRWAAFVDWLAAAGLLTRAAPSRTPDGVDTVSLDDLRSGKGGEAVPAPAPQALFTNEYLP